MASAMFFLPFKPAFGSRGLPVGSANVTFYATGTTTKQAVFYDEALTQQAPNPVQADGLGLFPTLYMDSAKTYRVRVTDAYGAPIGPDVDPYVPGTLDGLIGPTGPANATFATIAAIAASPITNLSAILSPAEGSGLTPATYHWTPGDFTGRNDVIASNSVPISQGAWVQQGASGIIYQAPGAPAIVRALGSKVGDVISIKDFGAKGDGYTDDTAAIQRVFDYATANLLTIHGPDGNYLTGPVLFGTNEIKASGNNASPLGLHGESGQGFQFVARKGLPVNTTLFQAWSCAGVRFQHIQFNGNGQPIKLCDWDWKAENGPSTLNVLAYIRAKNCPGAAVAVSLNGLNDTEPFKLVVTTDEDPNSATYGSNIAIQARQPGGHMRLINCSGVGGYLDLNAQNLTLDHCLDEGIQLTTGADNICTIIGGQSYGNKAKKAAMWSDTKGLNSGIMGLDITGRYYPLNPAVTALLDLSIYANLSIIRNCEFLCQGVELLAPLCTSSSGIPVRVLVQSSIAKSSGGGVKAMGFHDTVNVNGAVIAVAEGVMDTTTGLPVNKHWGGDLSAVKLHGNTGTPIQVVGTWRRTNDIVTFNLRVDSTSGMTANLPFILDGMPFADDATGLRAISRGVGSAVYANAVFDTQGNQLVGFGVNTDAQPFVVPAAGFVTIAGEYSVAS